MTPGDFFEALDKFGTFGVLILIIIGGMRGLYVWKWQHDELRQDRDDWKTLALSGTAIAGRAVDAVRGKSKR